MTTIAQRMQLAMDAQGIKQADLVRATGIGKSSISTYLSGDYEPKQKNIYKIAMALNVNEAWLMGYDVPMERTSVGHEDTEKAPANNSGRQISEEDIKRGFFQAAFSGDLKSLTDEQIDDYWEDAKSFLRFKISEGERGTKNEQTDRTLPGGRKGKD